MNGGWIKIHRKCLDKGWLKNPILWTLWTYLLLKASHKEHTMIVGYKEITLKPGQLVFGTRNASKELNVGRQQIRTALGFLENAQNLTRKVTHQFTIITIMNWDTYQVDQPTANPQPNPELTHEQPETRRERKKRKRNTIIPKDFSITKEMQTWFDKQNFQFLEIKEATDEFVDYWRGEGKTKKDWVATWRNGMRNKEKWAIKNNREDDSWKQKFLNQTS